MAQDTPNNPKQGNPRIKKLTEQNLELVAANKKLREDRDKLLTMFNDTRAEREEILGQKQDLVTKSQKLAHQNEELINANKRLRKDRDKILALADEKPTKTAKLEHNNPQVDTALHKNQQALDAENTQLRKDINTKNQTIGLLQTEAKRARTEVTSYANSTSWKITAPIRAVMNIFKRQ